MEFIQNIKLPRIEKDHTLPIITIAAATAALFYSTFRLVTFGNKKNYHQLGGIKEIPTPGSCYPVVGHMMSVGELPGRFFSKWHQKLGPIIQIYMGRQRWVVIDCPVLAHKIFVTSGVETSYRPHSIYAEQYYSKGK
jgi:hypothetical protein